MNNKLTFSQRQELEPAIPNIQYKSMNQALKNRLWNVLDVTYMALYKNKLETASFNNLMIVVWDRFFKLQICDKPSTNYAVYSQIKNWFSKADWNKVYDFLEFIPNNSSSSGYGYLNDNFIKYCNQVLIEECAGYRFADGLITEITSDEEIKSIEEAINNSIDPVKIHLKKALEHFSRRGNPDYRNSIKESISAVESLCKKITGNPKAELGEALNEIENKGILSIHPALKEGFKKIYGYTSDADGIRHGLKFEDNADSEDAKYMLVSCSAFINYLMSKCSKADISL